MSTTADEKLRLAHQEPRPPRGKRPGSYRRDKPNYILTVAMIACTCYFLIPLLWLAISSTKSTADLFDTFGLKFASHFELFTNLHNLVTYQNGAFLRWAGNTALYAGTSAVGAAALSTAAGYAFAKYDFAGKKIVFGVVLGSIMIPLTALTIPTYLLFSRIGIVNTPLAVILPCMISPFGVYLMRVYAASAIPDSLLEAARIDGAGEFRIFWQVGLRLMAPGIVTVFLLALVGTWNNYFLPLIMLSNSSLYPITVGLAQWSALATAGSGGHALFSTVITGAFVSILPLGVAFLYLQRYWQAGLTSGGVKG